MSEKVRKAWQIDRQLRLDAVPLDRRKRIAQRRFCGSRTVHTRRLAQQHVQRHIHRIVTEMAVAHG